MADKKADLAGPGIGDYEKLKQILPNDYRVKSGSLGEGGHMNR